MTSWAKRRKSLPRGQHKFNASRVECDGHMFQSLRERDHYLVLKAMAESGEIHGLKLQPKFEFAFPGITHPPKFLKIRSKGYPNGRKVRYVADFEFVRGGKRVVQDVKGMDTDVSRLKRALMEMFHGIKVEVIS